MISPMFAIRIALLSIFSSNLVNLVYHIKLLDANPDSIF